MTTKGVRWMGRLALAGALWCGTAGAGRAQGTPPEWQPHGRQRAYLRSLVGPGALLGIGVASAVDHARNDPPDWGDDAEGLMKRIASNAGRNAAQETIRHALAAAMDRSVVYQTCRCRGVGPRIAHAFVEAVTDRDRQGGRMISLPRFAGAYGGALIERSWRPDREPIDVLEIGTSTIVFGGLANVWKELVGWP